MAKLRKLHQWNQKLVLGFVVVLQELATFAKTFSFVVFITSTQCGIASREDGLGNDILSSSLFGHSTPPRCMQYTRLLEPVRSDLRAWKTRGVNSSLVEAAVRKLAARGSWYTPAEFLLHRGAVHTRPNLWSIGAWAGLHPQTKNQLETCLKRFSGLPSVIVYFWNQDWTEPVKEAPVLSQWRRPGDLPLLIPDHHSLEFAATALASPVPWDQKLEKVIFAGTVVPAGEAKQPLRAEAKQHMEKHPSRMVFKEGRSVSRKQQHHYKYLLYLDGSGMSTRLAALLASGSVTLFTSMWENWYSRALRSFREFVPLSGIVQLSHVVETLRREDGLAKRVARAARSFASEFLVEDCVCCIWHELISGYAEVVGTQDVGDIERDWVSVEPPDKRFEALDTERIERCKKASKSPGFFCF
eukprot:TRINITY_DN22531_c0_g1_i2.p1 TRINITY_DN22531_c0_g1~~TRINITY_DN22531_c0_g1_i2.p1  ORF type:complete len:413 (+),score=38.88 TRINITY_DN22531_c0_g1_i2:89-1327(+)